LQAFKRGFDFGGVADVNLDVERCTGNLEFSCGCGI
jgi:hypothetical protein